MKLICIQYLNKYNTTFIYLTCNFIKYSIRFVINSLCYKFLFCQFPKVFAIIRIIFTFHCTGSYSLHSVVSAVAQWIRTLFEIMWLGSIPTTGCCVKRIGAPLKQPRHPSSRGCVGVGVRQSVTRFLLDQRIPLSNELACL